MNKCAADAEIRELTESVLAKLYGIADEETRAKVWNWVSLDMWLIGGLPGRTHRGTLNQDDIAFLKRNPDKRERHVHIKRKLYESLMAHAEELAEDIRQLES